MRELVFAEEPCVGFAAVHMDRHGVGLLEQFIERVAALGVAHRELFVEVVEHHAHAERLGEHRKL